MIEFGYITEQQDAFSFQDVNPEPYDARRRYAEQLQERYRSESYFTNRRVVRQEQKDLAVRAHECSAQRLSTLNRFERAIHYEFVAWAQHGISTEGRQMERGLEDGTRNARIDPTTPASRTRFPS